MSTCKSYGGPKKSIEYKKAIKCSEFAENGFRCVPFYACKGGTVITDRGSGILQTGKTGLIHLVPNSKCTNDKNEICCQHPGPVHTIQLEIFFCKLNMTKKLLIHSYISSYIKNLDYQQIIGDHPFETFQIFTIFDPYPPTIGIPAKCL